MRVFFFMMVLIGVPPIASVVVQPDYGSSLRLVIVAPWADGHGLVETAGGTQVGPERAPFALFARAYDVEDFDKSARALGAW